MNNSRFEDEETKINTIDINCNDYFETDHLEEIARIMAEKGKMEKHDKILELRNIIICGIRTNDICQSHMQQQPVKI